MFYISTMNKKSPYFRPTTTQQRRLLFETWESTGNVKEACAKAHVCERTLYHWKPRFETEGYAGLESPQSRAPTNPSRTPVDVETRVIAMRRHHPTWGKRRLAGELAKENSWVPVVSLNTVRRILQDAGLWTAPETSAKNVNPQPVVRHAEVPGQTLNIDLCFVSLRHDARQKLPAVSGSSGRLVVEKATEKDADRQWPGRVFEHEEVDYTDAMVEFVAASQAKSSVTALGETAELREKRSLNVQKRALRHEETQLRNARRAVRQRRVQEDAAWKKIKAQRKKEKAAQPKPSPSQRTAQDATWHVLRQQRRETQQCRQEDDQTWRQKRRDFKERWGQLPSVTTWVAILVMTDNCTRQCPGLPLFVAGSRVTSDMIIETLRVLLPPELQFLITDRGTHFRANAFEQFARDEGFIHVLIARHRPQSNGIAERFVRTLKEWLRDTSWENAQELAPLLEQFLKEYNNRPHQGLPIPDLSPNEFENRIWLM